MPPAVTGRALYAQLGELLGLGDLRRVLHMSIELPADSAVIVTITTHAPFAGSAVQTTKYQVTPIEESYGQDRQTLPD